MLNDVVSTVKHSAILTAQATKTGIVDAANSSGVHWVIAFFTYLASISDVELARYVAIGVGLSVITKNIIDSYINWRKHKREQIADKKKADSSADQ
jgi:hypothetical protein